MKSTKRITIGIDARLSGSKHAGIGRYIENLLRELLLHKDNSINWVLFFQDQTQAEQVLSGLNHANHIKRVIAPIRHYSFNEQCAWPLTLGKYRLDLLHIPHFNIPLAYSGKMVITIHDLLWHQQIGPEVTTLSTWKYYLKYVAYRLVTSLALKKSLKIFVPTRIVQADIVELEPSAKNKIVITPEGISHAFKKQCKYLLNSQKRPNNYLSKTLVYVGSLYPHKNIEVVLQMLRQDSSYRLKIICSRNVFVERTKKRVSELGLIERVEFLGYLSDEELIKVIQTALALIQPSKSEGFGLTGIESMAVGTPVLASDLAVFKEIYKDAPIYFNPDNASELHKKMQALHNQSQYQVHQERGLILANAYSWKEMASQTLMSYLEIVIDDK